MASIRFYKDVSTNDSKLEYEAVTSLLVNASDTFEDELIWHRSIGAEHGTDTGMVCWVYEEDLNEILNEHGEEIKSEWDEYNKTFPDDTTFEQFKDIVHDNYALYMVFDN